LVTSLVIVKDSCTDAFSDVPSEADRLTPVALLAIVVEDNTGVLEDRAAGAHAALLAANLFAVDDCGGAELLAAGPADVADALATTQIITQILNNSVI
jgi:hypothetical protein